MYDDSEGIHAGSVSVHLVAASESGMSSHPYAEVLVEFFPTVSGGRKTPPRLNDHGYRPHLRVIGNTELLRVEFVDGPDDLSFGVSTYATAKFLYVPNVSYQLLNIGTNFEIVEGTKVVGRGTVTRR